jgi:uncharacterized membrane protein (DUF485 family)
MKSIRQAIALVLLMTLALTVLGSVLFIGFGALLSLWLPLSLFQASCLAIGAAFTLAVTIFALTYIVHFQAAHAFDDDLIDWDAIDDEDDHSPFAEPERPKVGRNAPCPCGSEKKYKYCCGN